MTEEGRMEAASRTLSTDEVAFFRHNGYLALDRLVAGGELALLRTLYDRILADRRAYSIHFDGGGTIHQVMSPDTLHPELRFTDAFRHGRRLACQLLGIAEDGLHGFFTHMIYKPARTGRDTPWHQDEAYWNDPCHRAHSLSVWIPLDPVTVESGCMQFLPRSHERDVLRHRAQAGAQPLALDEDVDLRAAVACPLAAGGATFHHCRTLHATGPNVSDIERRAWSLAFHAPPARRDVPDARPWLADFLAPGARA